MTEEQARELLEDQLGLNLDGPDGNAWVVMAQTGKFLKDAIGMPREDISAIMDTARSGDYTNLLITCAGAIADNM